MDIRAARKREAAGRQPFLSEYTNWRLGMKKIFMLIVTIGLLSTAAVAETQYVSGVLKITLRSGPGIDHRVLAMITTGERLEVINADNPEWTEVRTDTGNQGWVLSRFLTDRVPDTIVLEGLREKNQSLSQQVTTLRDENSRLKKSQTSLENHLKDSGKEVTALQTSYETLKKDSANLIELKQNYQKTSARLSRQIDVNRKLETELSGLRLRQNIKWFLAGAGVLLVGYLLGSSARRQRRKSLLQ